MPSSSSYTLAVIDKFTGSDLSAADVEYAAWKAKHQRKHIHKHASKHSKHQAASFESASPDEILDFVESLSLSEIDHINAYIKWTEKKQVLSAAKQERQEWLTLKREREALESKIKEEERKLIISQRTMEWHKRKKQLKREAAEKAKNEAREATKLANERHAESKMKFKQWEQQKSQCPGKDFEIPKHRQAWMSAPPSPTEELQPTNPLQYSLLSPPNLYAEYSFYQKAAPEFVLKYPNFVASGGRTYTLAVPRKSPTKTRMTKHI